MFVFVDLDRTIIPFDTTIHALKMVLINRPLIEVIKNLIKGKKCFKNYLLNNVDWDSIEYPINMSVFNYVNKMKNDGHTIYLLSGSNQKIVDAISTRLKIFDKSIGSNEDFPRLKFRNKLTYINQILGTCQWVYIADAYRDVVVWKKSTLPILVSNSQLKFFIISYFKVKKLGLIKVDSVRISLPNSEF